MYSASTGASLKNFCVHSKFGILHCNITYENMNQLLLQISWNLLKYKYMFRQHVLMWERHFPPFVR